MIHKENASLEAKVYIELQDAILSEQFKKGEALTETVLSEKFGVSRTPVRSALQRLSEDGLVKIVPNRGAVVLGVTKEDILDIYRIRMRLEGLASAMAAQTITDEYKKKLTETVELSEFYLQKNDTEHLKELDTSFHRMIYEASGSQTIARILSDLHLHTKGYRRIALAVPGRLEKTTEEHREILNAILEGNAEEADRLTCEHIEHALANMMTALSDIE
ncbi:MAG: GntR family transcriptional regulator [Clostridia bacterium]|nr:GntR family transcriptional regulator [Clostridia bacterium]